MLPDVYFTGKNWVGCATSDNAKQTKGFLNTLITSAERGRYQADSHQGNIAEISQISVFLATSRWSIDDPSTPHKHDTLIMKRRLFSTTFRTLSHENPLVHPPCPTPRNPHLHLTHHSTSGPPPLRRTPRTPPAPARPTRKTQHPQCPQSDSRLVRKRRRGKINNSRQPRLGLRSAGPPQRRAGHRHFRPQHTYIVESKRGAEAER